MSISIAQDHSGGRAPELRPFSYRFLHRMVLEDVVSALRTVWALLPMQFFVCPYSASYFF